MRALGIAGLAGLAGLVAGLGITSSADAQMVVRGGPSGIVIASDLDGPYDDLPPPLPPRYGPPAYSRSYAVPPPVPYGPPPVDSRLNYGPALPIHEVYRIVRDNGYSPLGSPQMRGNVITISVLDEDGEDGRLVIDAYSGRIVRFIPAYSREGRNSLAKPKAYTSVPLPKPRVVAALVEKKPQIPAASIAAEVQPKQQLTIQPTQAMPPVLGAE